MLPMCTFAIIHSTSGCVGVKHDLPKRIKKQASPRPSQIKAAGNAGGFYVARLPVLLEQGQHRLRLLIGLGQHRRSGLLNNLPLRQLGGCQRVVGIHDPAA